jgi:N-formylglutamate deformylase
MNPPPDRRAVRVTAPTVAPVPLVFASPHSGSDYPAAFGAAARLDRLELRRSEDCYVDELFAGAGTHGATMVAATFPRAFCDANREAWELDPAMFEDALPEWVNTASARVGAGLVTIARVVAAGAPIYRAKLSFAEARARVAATWQPFHAALREAVESTRRRFGACLLVDCHSMPEASMAPRQRADVVLGDAHGTSCAPAIMRRVEEALVREGLRVRRNEPYAGGYITRHYGRPREKVEVIQIEISRGLYMDEQNFTDRPGFDTLRATLMRFLKRMIAANRPGGAMDFGFSAAAE